MANITWNGTNYDNHLGHAAITTSTVTVTTTGITSATTTAPNTTNKATGVWIWLNALPTGSNNYVVTVQESTVDKVSATILLADMKIGLNYVRFTTPYQFTTTSAGALRVKVNSTSTNSGSLRTAASGLWYAITYDSGVSFASGDNIYNAGWHNSGLTTKTLTLTGTVGTIGDGTDKSINSYTAVTSGAAISVGVGGVVELDPAANTTLTIRGSVVPTGGGLFRSKPNSLSIAHTMIMDNETTSGDYGFTTTSGTGGGYFDIQQTDRGELTTTYASGLGTAANPAIMQTAVDWQVGDEVVIAGNAYNESEVRFIITRNSSTSFVWSSTSGGAETALVNTHAAGVHCSSLSSNVIIKPLNTARGWWYYNVGYGSGLTSILEARCEYASAASGDGLIVVQNSVSGDALGRVNGLRALYNTSNRELVSISYTKTAQTHTDIITYGSTCTNGLGSASIRLSGTANQTLERCIAYSAAGASTGGPLFAITGAAASNTLSDCHFYGGNASNSANNSSWYIAAFGNTFNNCSINGSRVRGILFAGAVENVWNNLRSGDIGDNTIDVDVTADTLNTAVFNNSIMESTALIDNYELMLSGSRIGFHRLQDTDRKHEAYQPNVIIVSSGSGLTDTTADTTFDTDSLAMKNTPLSASIYGEYDFYMPQRAGNTVIFSGKLYKTSDFNGDAIINLYLDGSSTPDDTYTLSGSHSTWIPFVLNADYTSGTVDRNARVEIKVRGTLGSVYMDTLFNSAKLTNPIGSLDLWQNGTPNEYLVSTVASAAEIASAVWTDTNTYTGNQKGKVLVDANDNAELASIT